MSASNQKGVPWRLWRAYRLRWKRRYFLARAIRRRRQLHVVERRTDGIAKGDILLFASVRNEMGRLPHFLDYHRNLGVAHFLIVDNSSTDGTKEHLSAQPDVSLWQTKSSYKLSRFGIDWLTWLQFRYGHGHWCLTLDADELFLMPRGEEKNLRDLTAWLERNGFETLGALMLDLYPKGRVGAQDFTAGDDPLKVLRWFDPDGYTSTPRPELRSRIVRGGPRARMFFVTQPDRAPTLNKVPLVHWNRRFAYLTSTHVVLPPRLNHLQGKTGGEPPTGVLLHTKFLPEIVKKSAEEKFRAEHFSNSAAYDAYYDALAGSPNFWTANSIEFRDAAQLESIGLMTRGSWQD